MAIERFGREAVHGTFGLMEHLAKEQRSHAMMNRDGLCHGFESAMEFASAHPLLLVGAIGVAALIKTFASKE